VYRDVDDAADDDADHDKQSRHRAQVQLRQGGHHELAEHERQKQQQDDEED
jgi:hypothetical protein